MERKLASIQVISEILPHPNADKLELAKVLGWMAIVLKGQFHKGDTVVYIETDSILPAGRAEWEFMRDRKFHVKTIKLRGEISQGLVFPISILPNSLKEVGVCLEGLDVTELLGITQYQPYVSAQLAGQVKGPFPEFLHKTDETRIQSIPELLEKHQDKKFIVTEKLDGSSMTVYLNNGEFGVCSRNMDLKETEDNAYWKVVRAEGIEEEMRTLAADPELGLKNFAVQGELIGPGVQGNKYNLKSLQFAIFNIFNIDTGRYVDLKPTKYEECTSYGFDFINKTSFFLHVPLLSIDYLLPKTTAELVEFSKGNSFLNPKVLREGIVLRPFIEEYSEELRGRLSFKCINPDFLIKFDSE